MNFDLNEIITKLTPNVGTVVWGLIVFFSKHYWDKYNAKKLRNTEADKRRAKSLTEDLPNFQVIEYWFDTIDFNNPFETDNFQRFYNVIQDYNSNPMKTISNKKVGKLINKIEQLCKQINHKIGYDTFPHGNNEQTVKRLKYNYNIDDVETPKFLNEKTTEVFNKYSELIRLFRSEQLID